MEHSGQIDRGDARPVRIELLVVDLMNRLLDPGPEGIDGAVNAALARIGTACGLSRCFVFRVQDDGLHRNTHEWVAPGVAPLIGQMQAIDPEEHPTWNAAFLAGELVAVSDRYDLPPDGPERLFLEQINTHATLMQPLRDVGRLLAVIGYDSETPGRRWGEDEIFLLTSVGRALASALLRAEATLAEAESRDHLEATLRALPDLVIELCPAGHIAACHSDNLPWLSRLVHAGIGRHVTEILPENLSRALIDLMENPPATGTARTRRVGVSTLVSPHWYEVSVAPMALRQSSDAAGVVAVIRDLSSAQGSSEMASYREGQFTAFFEMSPHPILLADFDTGKVLDGNRAFQQVFGLDPQQGRGIRHILPRGAGGLIDAAVSALTATGSFGPIEASLVRASGRRFPAVMRGFMSIDPNGRRLVWTLIEDVTEIRAKEAALLKEQHALKATRTRLVTAIEALDDGFAIFDADDRLVLWNKPYTRVFAGIADLLVEGALYDDLLRAAIDRGIFGAKGERDDVSLGRRLNRPLTEIWDGEDTYADGRVIWVRERATPSRETVGLYEDVTARRQVDRRLQQVVEGGEVAVWDWDVETGLSAMNDMWRSMLGFEGGSITLDDLRSLLHHDDLPAIEEVRQSLFRQDSDDFDLLCRVRHSAGRWIWLLSRGRVLARRSDGMPRRISGFTLDVSARIEAEQRLTRLIDGARVGTWEHDLNARISQVNDRWAEILGYRASELNPLPLERWLALVHPDDARMIEETTARSFSGGQWVIEHEIRLRHREGHWVWVLSRGQVTEWDAVGRPLQVSGVHLDISAAKALEVALARERDALARIMETSVSGIIAVDGAGKVVFANAAAERVLGRPVAAQDDLPQILAMANVTDMAGHAVAPADFPVTLALAGQGAQHDVRHAILWRCGTRRVLSVNAARLSAPGTGLAVLCSLTDITDTVESEDRLRAAMASAEAANQAKSEFLAAMSHEMRTPLNGVLGMVELLSARLRDSEHRQMLQIIRDSGEHLLSVINDILDLAKIEAGKLTLDPGPIALCRIVDRIAALHGFRAREKGVQLTTECLGDYRDALRLGDEKRVIQILHNLVGNAIKFTEAGEIVLRIDCSSTSRLGIEVQDSGIGMTEAEMARVFEEFRQGQGGISRRYGGTGLGLPIVRRLAQLMGGEVSLSGAPGLGLTARVDVQMPVLPGVPRSEPDPVRLPLAPMSVLVAEDNATNRIILGSMLQALGIRATVVPGGDAAIDVWQPGTFDAVLLDIAMPGRDGLATLLALQAKAAASGVASPLAIAVTANAMTHQVQDYLSRGFVACVAKPLRSDRLAAALLAAQTRSGSD